MKINRLFFALSTSLAILPMNAKAGDSDKIPVEMGSGASTPKVTLTTGKPADEQSDRISNVNNQSSSSVPSSSVVLGYRDPSIMEGRRAGVQVSKTSGGNKTGFPIKMRTGLDTTASTIKTTGDYKRDFSQVVDEINGISKSEIAAISARSIQALHEIQMNDAKRFVAKEILDFIPAPLLSEVDYKPGDNPITLGQKHFRLALKLTDYCNLLPDFLLVKIRENSEFIREAVANNTPENYRRVEELVDGFKIGDTPLPQGVKEILLNFLYSDTPTPARLMDVIRYQKNKYIGIQMIMSANSMIKNIHLVEPNLQSDALFSAALAYKWAGDRLGANWDKHHAHRTGSEPYYYSFYHRSLDAHKMAMDRLPIAGDEFKTKYNDALIKYGVSIISEAFKGYFPQESTHPIDQSTQFLANPLSVMPKGLKLAN